MKNAQGTQLMFVNVISLGNIFEVIWNQLGNQILGKKRILLFLQHIFRIGT